MTATKKQSETAAILRAGRSKAASHNAAAKKAIKPAVTDDTPRRVMVTLPADKYEAVKAAAKSRMLSMNQYFIFAAVESATRDGYINPE